MAAYPQQAALRIQEGSSPQCTHLSPEPLGSLSHPRSHPPPPLEDSDSHELPVRCASALPSAPPRVRVRGGAVASTHYWSARVVLAVAAAHRQLRRRARAAVVPCARGLAHTPSKVPYAPIGRWRLFWGPSQGPQGARRCTHQRPRPLHGTGGSNRSHRAPHARLLGAAACAARRGETLRRRGVWRFSRRRRRG